MEARLPLRDLVAHRPRWGMAREVRIEASRGDDVRLAPLRLPPALANRVRVARTGRRLYVVRSGRQSDGEFALDVIPVTSTRVMRGIWEKLVRRRERPSGRAARSD